MAGGPDLSLTHCSLSSLSSLSSLPDIACYDHTRVITFRCPVLSVHTRPTTPHSLIIASKYGTAGSPAQGPHNGALSQSWARMGTGDQSEEAELPALSPHGVIPLQQSTIKYFVLQKVRIWALDSDYEASRGRKTKTNFPLIFAMEERRQNMNWL